MQNFASVGKAMLIQAVGIQSNYTEEVTTMIDREKSGCDSCPFSFYESGTNCINCTLKCYVTKKIYVNEKNKYGSKPRLKINALKILLYLHFLRPDSNGIVKDVPMKELAELLNCDLRTVTNNFKLLDEFGYIKYTSTYNGKRNILLTGYKDYFKPAKEGGRGYVVLNKAFMERMLDEKNLITLRIHLRNMVEIDALNREEGYSINVLAKTYKSMQRELPTYCKRNVIQKAIPDSNDIFIIKHDSGSNQVRFVLKDEFIAKKQRKEELDKLYRKVFDVIQNINYTVMQFSEYSLPVEDPFYSILAKAKNEPGVINITSKEIYNIAQLAEYYSFEEVEQALYILYENYFINPIECIDSYGAVIHNIIKRRAYAFDMGVA